MDDLETGKDKIKKICEILKNESIEPAKLEAQRIVDEASEHAHEMLREAEKKAHSIIEEGRKKMEKERALFNASLEAASKQALENLRQEIEKNLFNKELFEFVNKGASDEKTAAQLIAALVQAVEKEGISADFSALIPQSLPADKVNKLLAKDVLERLREKSVVLGDFMSGVQIKLHDKQMILDLSDTALRELLGKYLRKDFRQFLFGASHG